MENFLRGWVMGTVGEGPRPEASEAELRGYWLAKQALSDAMILEDARAKAEARASRGGPVSAERALEIKRAVQDGEYRR